LNIFETLAECLHFLHN